MRKPFMPLARLQIAWWDRAGGLLALVLIAAAIMALAGVLAAIIPPGHPPGCRAALPGRAYPDCALVRHRPLLPAR